MVQSNTFTQQPSFLATSVTLTLKVPVGMLAKDATPSRNKPRETMQATEITVIIRIIYILYYIIYIIYYIIYIYPFISYPVNTNFKM